MVRPEHDKVNVFHFSSLREYSEWPLSTRFAEGADKTAPNARSERVVQARERGLAPYRLGTI